MHVIVHYHVPYLHYYQWFSVCGQLDNELCVVRSLSKFIGGILRFMIDFIVLSYRVLDHYSLIEPIIIICYDN